VRFVIIQNEIGKIDTFSSKRIFNGFFFSAMPHTPLTFTFIYYKLLKNDYCRHKLINLNTTTENALLVFNSIFAITKMHFMQLFDFLIISLYVM